MRILPTSIEDIFEVAAYTPLDEILRRLCENKLTDLTLTNKHVANLDDNNENDRLSFQRMQRLLSSLRSNTTVRTVWLRDVTFLDDEEEREFLDAVLGDSSAVTDLYIGGACLAGQGSLKLASLLRENTTLESLNLQLVRFPSEGLEALVDALRDNVTLTDLGFYKSLITDDDVARIASLLLREKSALTDLDLSSNALSYESVASLASAFQRSGTVRTLDLSYCKVDDRGASALAAAVLRRTAVATPAAHKFGSRYRAPETLRTVYFFTGLDLEGNYFCAERLSLLRAAALVRARCWTLEDKFLPLALERSGATRHLDAMYELGRARPEIFLVRT